MILLTTFCITHSHAAGARQNRQERPAAARRQTSAPIAAVIRSIDPARRSLTVATRQGEQIIEKTCGISANAQVRLLRRDAREPGELADLTPNMPVSIRFRVGTDEVTAITVTAGPRVSGVIKSVDASNNRLIATVRGQGTERIEKTYALAPEPRVIITGSPEREGRLSNLIPGRAAVLELSLLDPTQVTGIRLVIKPGAVAYVEDVDLEANTLTVLSDEDDQFILRTYELADKVDVVFVASKRSRQPGRLDELVEGLAVTLRRQDGRIAGITVLEIQ